MPAHPSSKLPKGNKEFYVLAIRHYYRSDVSVSFASGVLCALSPLARFPSFVLCPAWYAGCFGARGVGRAHLARSAVLSPREDVCYRVSPFVFASCFYTRTQMQKVCPTHAKCGCSIIFRLCLTNLALIVYPYYTLAIPLHLRSDYFFIAFDKFVVADESIDGYNESADKVKN